MRPSELQRSLFAPIQRDLNKKIVILSGPRQCGKTTLSKSLFPASMDYLTYDAPEDRAQILNREWDRTKALVIFDELHKMPKWKAWLKGIYDKEGNSPRLLVTGSARLDTFRKTGDSLAGRHFSFRLHPFDLKELAANRYPLAADDCLERILNVGGYPEPFLQGDVPHYNRWRRGHLDLILRQDLPDFQTVRDTQSITLLIELLRQRVGSGISANALANDLGKDPKTVQKWLGILEDLFIVFRLTPSTGSIARSLKKEPKYYFYDTGLVEGPDRLRDGARLENAVACALLKECHRLNDAEGIEFEMHYLKVKGGREIDFVLVPKDRRHRPHLIEVKTSDAEASPNFKLFAPHFKNPRMFQLVKELGRNFTTAQHVHVIRASEWLQTFDLTTARES
jgi:predicted AAA+ superfamily ATPase